jgi:hypothetical protein
MHQVECQVRGKGEGGCTRYTRFRHCCDTLLQVINGGSKRWCQVRSLFRKQCLEQFIQPTIVDVISRVGNWGPIQAVSGQSSGEESAPWFSAKQW